MKKYLYTINGVDSFKTKEEKKMLDEIGISPLATIDYVAETNQIKSVVAHESDKLSGVAIRRVGKNAEAGKTGKPKEEMEKEASDIFTMLNKKDGTVAELFEEIEKFFTTNKATSLLLQPFHDGKDFWVADLDVQNKKNDAVKFENMNAKGVPIRQLFSTAKNSSKTFEGRVMDLYERHRKNPKNCGQDDCYLPNCFAIKDVELSLEMDRIVGNLK